MANIIEYIREIEQESPNYMEQKNAFYILKLYLDFSALSKPIIDKILEIFECYLAQKVCQTMISKRDLNSQIGLGKSTNINAVWCFCQNLVASISDDQFIIILPFCNHHIKSIFGFDCDSLSFVDSKPLVEYDGYLYDNDLLDERAKVINPKIIITDNFSPLHWLCVTADALCDRCGKSTYILIKTHYVAVERLCIKCNNQFARKAKCNKCDKKRYNYYSFLARSCIDHGGNDEKPQYSKEIRTYM